MSYKYYRHHHHYRRRNEDSGIGSILRMLLGFIAMPIVGVALMQSNDSDHKEIGQLLLFVGAILWFEVCIRML